MKSFIAICLMCMSSISAAQHQGYWMPNSPEVAISNTPEKVCIDYVDYYNKMHPNIYIYIYYDILDHGDDTYTCRFTSNSPYSQGYIFHGSQIREAIDCVKYGCHP